MMHGSGETAEGGDCLLLCLWVGHWLGPQLAEIFHFKDGGDGRAKRQMPKSFKLARHYSKAILFACKGAAFLSCAHRLAIEAKAEVVPKQTKERSVERVKGAQAFGLICFVLLLSSH